jgi:integrase
VDDGLEMLTWDADQLREFLEATQEDRLFALWRLAAMTGMRRGGVLGLRWADVDLKAMTVTASRQRHRDKGIIVSPPKTDRGHRTIDIDAETVRILKDWRRAQLEEQVASDGEWPDTGMIFTKNGGAPLDPDVVSQRFDRLVGRAEVPRIRLHDMRHTHVTLLLGSGVPPHVVSVRLGHKSVAFTLQQYAHVLPQQQQAEAVERLASRLLDS